METPQTQDLYYFKEKDLMFSQGGDIIDLSKMSVGQKNRILKESGANEVGLITDVFTTEETII
jgi:hypothetical protein